MLVIPPNCHRCLTTWLLAAGREVQSLAAPPRVFDMLEPKRSVTMAALQYLSSLLRGRCSRLVFAYRQQGSTQTKFVYLLFFNVVDHIIVAFVLK